MIRMCDGSRQNTVSRRQARMTMIIMDLGYTDHSGETA